MSLHFLYIDISQKFKIISEKVLSANFVEIIESNDNECVSSKTICPICSQVITLPYIAGEGSIDPVWNMASFEDHVKFHEDYPDNEATENRRCCLLFQTHL